LAIGITPYIIYLYLFAQFLNISFQDRDYVNLISWAGTAASVEICELALDKKLIPAEG
jgi:hypothetical protein